KIGLLQPDVKNNDPEYNRAKLAWMILSDNPVDLCVAPAEALCGPDPTAALADPEFERDLSALLEALASDLRGASPLVCSAPGRGTLLINGGVIMDLPGEVLLNNERIVFLGDEAPPSGDILINLTATPYSPFSQKKQEEKIARHMNGENVFSAAVSVNLVGGYGPRVYNGQSFAIRPGGVLACRGAAFAEDFVVYDTASPPVSPIENIPEDLAQWLALVSGTRDFVHKSGATQVILGLSGGMDSAFVACVAAEALGPENVAGILMPSPWSSEGSVTDSLELAANLGIKTVSAPIESAMLAFDAILADPCAGLDAPLRPLAKENLQARIRGVILMAIANSSDALVLNTGNKSEAAMGYSTLYGDSVGALAVIGDLFKTRVYELAKAYNARSGGIIPPAILEKAPSAELRPGQK
ncbi:MAG: NAD(+) synthase, partial [Desulfovibrio sp.]|nr:NAD(+) synthase [Desulfovibrio sp.]